MRVPTPLPGLPIGRGDIWRRPASRALLLTLAAAGLTPLAGLTAVALGWVAPAGYLAGAVLPAIVAVAVGLALAAWREPHLLARAGVGLLAGWLGVLAYDVLVLTLQTLSPGRGPAIVWAGVELAPGVKTLAEAAPAYAHHWLATGALWGMAYALVAGRAHWAWGVAYGASLWVLVVGLASTAPFGSIMVPALDLGRAALLASGHVLFGAVLGAVNMLAQPPAPENAKIVFLRDYVAERQRARR